MCALTDYILLCTIIARHSTATALIDVIVTAIDVRVYCIILYIPARALRDDDIYTAIL